MLVQGCHEASPVTKPPWLDKPVQSTSSLMRQGAEGHPALNAAGALLKLSDYSQHDQCFSSVPALPLKSSMGLL